MSLLPISLVLDVLGPVWSSPSHWVSSLPIRNMGCWFWWLGPWGARQVSIATDNVDMSGIWSNKSLALSLPNRNIKGFKKFLIKKKLISKGQLWNWGPEELTQCIRKDGSTLVIAETEIGAQGSSPNTWRCIRMKFSGYRLNSTWGPEGALPKHQEW